MSTNPMLAVTYDRYGPSSSLRLTKVERPAVGDDEVLVRVAATSANPSDWHRLTGTPWFFRIQTGLRRPKRRILGTDLAGRVEAVGSNASGLAPGDEVFGWTHDGAFAEYVTVPMTNVARKPATITLEQAGAVAVAAFTALQALRDKGRVDAATRLLINGASGGVGTYTVQIAAALGAHVTAVCSTRNVEQSLRLGADRVIDYCNADVGDEPAGTYDVIVDNAGTLDFTTVRRLLTTDGTYVLVSGPKDNRMLGPLAHALKGAVRFAFSRQRLAVLVSTENAADLAVLAEMLTDGTVVPIIDRHYELADAAAAMTYLEGGHARAKISIRT
jgi:NADPH:quinone reductase-like Zn-dependent oxidoreductase